MLLEVASGFEDPISEMEVKLAGVWAHLLHVELATIGRQTSFFELGGDSISAIQLVAACEEIGLFLTTKLVFKKSSLRAMAMLVERQDLAVLAPLNVP